MAAATTTAASHNLLPHRPPNSISKLSSSFPLHFLRFTSNNSPFLHSSLSSSASSISGLTHLSTSFPPPPLHSEDEEYFKAEEEEEEEQEEEEEEEEESAVASAAVLLPSLPCPTLTVKEKKELASYAHSLGKKLKSQQVGKSGVTPSVAASFVENLESNELLKIKVHGNCPMEFIDVVKQLEKATGSVAVAQIGRSVILYRPSISKMKKRESQCAKKFWKPKPRQPAAYPVVRRGQLSRSSQNIVGKSSRD